MARYNPEIPHTRARVLILSTAVFILLSVPTFAEETKCFWCGPLAEQVHRSQRAPSCDDTVSEVTVCDKGFSYCAIVATSPPYIESRICVKFYQDECYSLYCNSTKSWRMTCPCRGDLCNGPSTSRETEAFTVLSKLSKSRIKRNAVTPANFINIATRTTTRIPNDTTVESNGETSTEMLPDQPTDNIEVNAAENGEVNEVTEAVESTQQAKAEEVENKTDINDDNTVKVSVQTLEIIMDPKTETFETITDAVIKNEIHILENTVGTTEQDSLITHQDLKPTVKLPAAEALQQNVTPAEKNIEDTTSSTETTFVTTTVNTLDVTTQATKGNNTAARMKNEIFTLLIGITLQHYFN